jgi:large subunit ribosomal protein L3
LDGLINCTQTTYACLQFTKEYCGLFKDSGVMPTKILGRFLISPEAAIQPGTPLHASHFKVGGYVDVRGKT